MWNTPNNEGGVWGFLGDSVQTAFMLTGRLAIMDMPKRILDTLGLILVNFAIIGIVPLVYAFKQKHWWNSILLWLIFVPAFYFFVNLSIQTYVYIQPSIAFGAIAVGIGLSKLNHKWTLATATCLILFFGFNATYFDIGKRLDPELSATKYYYEELPKVPDNHILMPQYGWEWAAIYLYNANENKKIIPVCVDTLVSPVYQKLLAEQGVKFSSFDEMEDDRLNRQNRIALSIVRMNDNVWTTNPTVPETYGCEVVPAKGNEKFLEKVPSEPPGQWHWIPSNPYAITTGELEVNEWKFITLSNHNAFFILSLVVYAFSIVWYIARYFKLRQKKAIET
jgi:hypothetical protein